MLESQPLISQKNHIFLSLICYFIIKIVSCVKNLPMAQINKIATFSAWCKFQWLNLKVFALGAGGGAAAHKLQLVKQFSWATRARERTSIPAWLREQRRIYIYARWCAHRLAGWCVRWVNAITMRPVFKMCSNINDVTLTKGKTANHSTEIAIPLAGCVVMLMVASLAAADTVLRAAFAPSFCTTMSTMGARR